MHGKLLRQTGCIATLLPSGCLLGNSAPQATPRQSATAKAHPAARPAMAAACPAQHRRRCRYAGRAAAAPAPVGARHPCVADLRSNERQRRPIGQGSRSAGHFGSTAGAWQAAALALRPPLPPSGTLAAAPHLAGGAPPPLPPPPLPPPPLPPPPPQKTPPPLPAAPLDVPPPLSAAPAPALVAAAPAAE